jgi:hypothetical protein
MDLDRTRTKNESEQNALENLSILLQTQKVRTKGSEKLIDGLIAIYKEITDVEYETKANSGSFETYKLVIGQKINPEIEEKINKIFKSNDVIDTLHIIIRHISDIKTSGFEKLINLLVKIKYLNQEHWKIILSQYLMYLSIVQTHYQPLDNRHITQILAHLKDMYKYLPFESDKELLQVLDRSISESINHLFKYLDQMNPEYFVITINSISKLGLMDETNTRNIENIMTDKLKDMPDNYFANILFSTFRNRCASESLYNILEQRCISVLESYKKGKGDTFVVTMIAKG